MEDQTPPEGAEDELRADEAAAEVQTDPEVEARGETPELEYRRSQVESLRGTTEHRQFPVSRMECRALDDGTLRMSGYASVTEQPYDIGDPKRGGFTETIKRGAFKRTLNEDPHVVLLINHEGLPLASTRNGSLTLREDATGLRWDADLDPADPESVAIARKVERGLIEDCSFAFRCTDDAWSDDFSERQVKSASIHKGDVSVVTFGASDATSVGLRALDDALVEQRAGKAISAKTRGELEAIKQTVDGLLAEPDKADDPAEPDVEAERAAEPVQETARVFVMPDFRERERLAALRRAR